VRDGSEIPKKEIGRNQAVVSCLDDVRLLVLGPALKRKKKPPSLQVGKGLRGPKPQEKATREATVGKEFSTKQIVSTAVLRKQTRGPSAGGTGEKKCLRTRKSQQHNGKKRGKKQENGVSSATVQGVGNGVEHGRKTTRSGGGRGGPWCQGNRRGSKKQSAQGDGEKSPPLDDLP